MKLVMILTILAALVVPTIAAAPNVQSGNQNGGFWVPQTAIAVQGGTNFLLAGAVGDHDIVFYNAAGQVVGWSIACGADRGVVPATAVTGVILQWDATGGAVPLCLLSMSGSSTWYYVDGF